MTKLIKLVSAEAALLADQRAKHRSLCADDLHSALSTLGLHGCRDALTAWLEAGEQDAGGEADSEESAIQKQEMKGMAAEEKLSCKCEQAKKKQEKQAETQRLKREMKGMATEEKLMRKHMQAMQKEEL